MQLDYAAFNALGDRGVMTGVWLEHCQACSAPEIACVFNRAGIDYHLVTVIFRTRTCGARCATGWTPRGCAAGMRENRLGVLGHYYCGMLDVYSDLAQQSAVFGTHIELLEMCELHALREAATEQRLNVKLTEFREQFHVSSACEPAELERAARTAAALDALVEKHRLGALAYYYEASRRTRTRIS
jgi:L-arabinose isomerase